MHDCTKQKSADTTWVSTTLCRSSVEQSGNGIIIIIMMILIITIIILIIIHTLKVVVGYLEGSVGTSLCAHPIIRQTHKPSSRYQASNVCNGENVKVLAVRRSGKCHVNLDHPAAAQRGDALKTL